MKGGASTYEQLGAHDEAEQERRATLAKTAGMADLEELIEFGSV
eukprot:COSAG06_NODE_52158_length_307_cov_1.086538_2_plen_43_part_01